MCKRNCVNDNLILFFVDLFHDYGYVDYML